MSYRPVVPWEKPMGKQFASVLLAGWGEGLRAWIPRISESVDTSNAAWWYRDGHADDLMQPEIWGGFRGPSK